MPMPLKIKLSVGRSHSSRKWTLKEYTFDELHTRLLKVKPTDETVEQYAAMPKPKRDEIKDCGGFVAAVLRDGIRKAQNVTCRTMWTADLDFIPADDVEAFLASLTFKCIVYTTHSHTLLRPRYRLLAPFLSDLPTDRYPAVSRLLAGDTKHIDYFDAVSFRAAQLMYWPTRPSDGEYICKVLNADKDFIDPDKVLEAHPNWRDFTKLPRTSRESEAKGIEGVMKQQDPFLKGGVIGAFCRVYDIPRAIETFLSDVYEPAGVDNRYTYKAGESTAGLVIYDQGRFAYSHHATDPAYGKLCNSYDLIMIHKWGEGHEKQMNAFALKDEKVNEEIAEARRQQAQGEFEGAELELPVLLLPEDYSDLGQAKILAREYSGSLKYSTATEFIVYNGSYWEESRPRAQGVAAELTDRQLDEVTDELDKAYQALAKDGVLDLLNATKATSQKIEKLPMTKSQRQQLVKYRGLLAYQMFVIKHRDFKFISSTLKATEHLVNVDPKDLDANEFLLNTPSGTVDLNTGEMREHRPEDLITKQTAVDPDEKGMEIWLAALEMFFPGNTELQNYVQDVVGMAAVGKVYEETMIIAYGDGRNGKSTLWNTIARVFGTYAGNLSSDTLVAFKNRNIGPELAEARGKRLLIAAELEEGMQLSTATVKKLCSTDPVFAEKKYKDPFAYIPTHTLVLYTNHLPRVRALDEGTWRRLAVIPFLAKIEGASDIKNYADYLFTTCGGAVLTWIIKGAMRVIENNFVIKKPACVEAASQQYRDNNDWLTPFLDSCCDVGKGLTEKSGELYRTYHDYCDQMRERAHSTTDFYTALQRSGFEKYRTAKGNIINGLRLKDEAELDFKGAGNYS